MTIPDVTTTSQETSYGGVVNRGTVVFENNVGPKNSVSFTKNDNNSLVVTTHNGNNTIKSIWALVDTTTGLTEQNDFPLFHFRNGTPIEFRVPSGSTLASGKSALLYFGELPSTHLFRYSTRRSISKAIKFDKDENQSFQESALVFLNNPLMSVGKNFNIYSLGFQFIDGTVTELQFINDNEGPNIVGDSIYQVADLTNKFSEMADLHGEDGTTHFAGRVYDAANLRINVEALFNKIILKVPSVLDHSQGANIINNLGEIQVIGSLEVSETGQPITEVSIQVSSSLQLLDVLFDQSVTFEGDDYDALRNFDRSTAGNFQAMNILRESFIQSFVKHIFFYFDNVNTAAPTEEVDAFLKEYLKPIRVRSRMLSMSALTGTNTVPVAGKTNTLNLNDSEQIWDMFTSLTIHPLQRTFETQVSHLIPLTTYSDYITQVRLYERTLMRGQDSDVSWTSTSQDPWNHAVKFLSILLDTVSSSADTLYVKKLLQIWNMARVHNHMYDSDRQEVWNGSTVDDLQLEIYVQYGYGATYEWLKDAAGFFSAVSEPTSLETEFIRQDLLDRIKVHLRLDDWAGSYRPAGISDAYEQTGWVAFVDAFMRYYLWSATATPNLGEFNSEQQFIGKKASFLRAYDASKIDNPTFTADEHILHAAKSVLTTNSNGTYPEAEAFTNEFVRIRNLNSSTFWADVITKRLNHLPYHVVWHQTENMVAKPVSSAITQNAEDLLAVMNALVDFYAKTTTVDELANSSVPHIYDWYKAVGYLAAIPQVLPENNTMFGAEIGFATTVRANYPFVDTHTVSPKGFFEEMTRRLFQFHRCDLTFAVSGSFDSSHNNSNTFSFNPLQQVIGAYDPNTDKYVSGFRGLKNVNNYYVLLKKENDLRLAISNQESEFDLEDLERIFNEANLALQAQMDALSTTNQDVQSDIISLGEFVDQFHDPYSGSGLLDKLHVRYIQVSSENRAQAVLKDTYNAFTGLLTQVRTVSTSVTDLQIEYQTKLKAYNTSFDMYIQAYNQWNSLIDSVSDLLNPTTSYVDLLRARVKLTAEVSHLREKFNSDVTQIKSTITAIQQTFINLKSQGVRTIPTSANTDSAFTFGDVTFTRRTETLFPIVNLLKFVPK